MNRFHISFEKFKNYSFIFENISKNDVLKKELAEYGYGDKEIAQGKALYDTAAKRLKLSTKRSLKSLLPFISKEWRLCVPISSLKTSRLSTKSSKPNPICSPHSTNLKSLLSISKPSSPPSPM